jgi:LAS superfamily LD-carboxypeptidase LdcB
LVTHQTAGVILGMQLSHTGPLMFFLKRSLEFALSNAALLLEKPACPVQSPRVRCKGLGSSTDFLSATPNNHMVLACMVMHSHRDNQLLLSIHSELGIPSSYAETTKLTFFTEVALSRLVVAQLDDAGRPVVLTSPATKAWLAMRDAARSDQIELLPFSGFRSYLYQCGLVRAKLAKGQTIEQILTILAAPGYSEHHTGEALDITTVNCPQADEQFAETDAHAWLTKHAIRFGFKESFPADNQHGLVYEPWHWRFHSAS